MSFKPIGTLINKPSKITKKSSEALFAIQIRQVSRQTIERECSDLPVEVLKLLKVISFKKGVLVIACPHLLSAELSMRSSGLIEEINGAFGKRIIYSIKFKII